MTKSQLNERCKSILYGSGPYKPISQEDQDWLMNNIFNHHPERGWFDEKGVVDHIEPRHDKSRFHSLCFNIVFTDGSIYDISFYKCNIRYVIGDKMTQWDSWKLGFIDMMVKIMDKVVDITEENKLPF